MKRSLLPCSLLLLCSSAFAQEELVLADSAAIGGTADMETYEEDLFVEEDAGEENASTWSALDSLAYIPAHDIYGTWNTERFFSPREIAADGDSLVLMVSHLPCDHAFPTCGRTTSKYGPRRGRMHHGVDLKLEVGDPVLAAFDGMVRISRWNRTFGNVVVVRHHNGLETLYAHLSELKVEPGQEVEAGDLLGLGGSTGRSTGSHLHFEVRYLGRSIDPERLFDLNEGELRTERLALGKRSLVTSTTASSSSTRIHTVRRGETLYSIARKHGTSVQALCRMNGIRSSSTLRVGQRVKFR